MNEQQQDVLMLLIQYIIYKKLPFHCNELVSTNTIANFKKRRSLLCLEGVFFACNLANVLLIQVLN